MGTGGVPGDVCAIAVPSGEEMLSVIPADTQDTAARIPASGAWQKAGRLEMGRDDEDELDDFDDEDEDEDEIDDLDDDSDPDDTGEDFDEDDDSKVG